MTKLTAQKELFIKVKRDMNESKAKPLDEKVNGFEVIAYNIEGLPLVALSENDGVAMDTGFYELQDLQNEDYTPVIKGGVIYPRYAV
jgi:hypothetical protein